MRAMRRGTWCYDVVRETQKRLMKLRFEGGRSESGREQIVHRPGMARGRVNGRDRNPSKWTAESGGGGMKELAGSAVAPP